MYCKVKNCCYDYSHNNLYGHWPTEKSWNPAWSISHFVFYKYKENLYMIFFALKHYDNIDSSKLTINVKER